MKHQLQSVALSEHVPAALCVSVVSAVRSALRQIPVLWRQFIT